MLQRLRDWWTLLTASPVSREYDEAYDRKHPGHLERQAAATASWQQRRQWETEWFASLVTLQQAGRIEEAERLTRVDLAAGNLSFVNEPHERLAELYALDVDRLLTLGDVAGARAAADHAHNLMREWASYSTSGGEGTARSSAAAALYNRLAEKFTG